MGVELMKMVFASSNQGKAREIKTFVEKEAIDLLLQSDLGVVDIPETGQTFIENALLKARHATEMTKLPALADDSGLIVPALNGDPGIYSARYAGEQANATDNIKKLLAELKQTPDEKRQATFYCVLVFMRHSRDPAPLICEGQWSGVILHEPSGTQGFGYDPIFYVPSEKKSAAELPLEIKNKISHRGQALDLLMEKLNKICMHFQ